MKETSVNNKHSDEDDESGIYAIYNHIFKLLLIFNARCKKIKTDFSFLLFFRISQETTIIIMQTNQEEKDTKDQDQIISYC